MSDVYTQEILQSLDGELSFNYLNICNYIQKFLQRSDQDTINAIPQFIALAESRLAIDLKFLPGVVTNRFTIDPSLPISLPCSVIVDKPAGWRETKNISFIGNNGRAYVYPRSYEYLQLYLEDFSLADLESQDNLADLIFYADIDNNRWIFAPYKRDQSYQMEVMYYATIPPLSSTNVNNYWTIFCPRALIYAAVYEASYWARSDTRTSNFWMNEYNNVIAGLQKQNANNFIDNSIQRTNQ